MQTTIHTHDHDASLGATQDLINTLELSDDGPTDSLASPDAALAFLAERDLGHPADLEAQAGTDGDAWLARVIEARAALRDVWDAQVEQRPASAAGAGDAQRAPRPEPPGRAARRADRRRGLAPAPGGRPHRRGPRPPGDPARRGDRQRRDGPLPGLCQPRLSLGVRGRVASRPSPLVRHVELRQPGEGPPLPRAPQGHGRRRIRSPARSRSSTSAERRIAQALAARRRVVRRPRQRAHRGTDQPPGAPSVALTRRSVERIRR